MGECGLPAHRRLEHRRRSDLLRALLPVSSCSLFSAPSTRISLSPPSPALRRRELVRMRQPLGDLGPLRPAIQVDADPSSDTDIGRHEVPLGRLGDEEVLRGVRGVAPHGVTPRAVVIVRVGEAREHPLPDPERRLAVRDLLPSVRQRLAQGAQFLERGIDSPSFTCHAPYL